MKKITLLSFLAVFMMSSVAFGKTEVKSEANRGRGCHEDKYEKCCKELEKFKCLLEGIDSNSDKANCRLEDLLCIVNRLLEILDFDLGCKVNHIENGVNCIKENTNEILHCALQHIKEKLCLILSVDLDIQAQLTAFIAAQTIVNANLNAFLDCEPCSALDQIIINTLPV